MLFTWRRSPKTISCAFWSYCRFHGLLFAGGSAAWKLVPSRSRPPVRRASRAATASVPRRTRPGGATGSRGPRADAPRRSTRSGTPGGGATSQRSSGEVVREGLPQSICLTASGRRAGRGAGGSFPNPGGPARCPWWEVGFPGRRKCVAECQFRADSVMRRRSGAPAMGGGSGWTRPGASPGMNTAEDDLRSALEGYVDPAMQMRCGSTGAQPETWVTLRPET